MSHPAELKSPASFRSAVSIETPKLSISTITIPTRNRVDGLQRTLESFVENCRRFGRNTEFVVADDSGDPSVRARCRQMLSRLGRSHAVPIRYIGFEEKIRFAKQLMDGGKIPADVVKFA